MITQISTSDITKSAIKELSYRGYEVWRQNQIPVKGRKFIGKRGLSDIIGYRKSDGKSVYCEVKNTGDSLSDDQKEFLDKAKSSGCITLVAGVKSGLISIEEY